MKINIDTVVKFFLSKSNFYVDKHLFTYNSSWNFMEEYNNQAEFPSNTKHNYVFKL